MRFPRQDVLDPLNHRQRGPLVPILRTVPSQTLVSMALRPRRLPGLRCASRLTRPVLRISPVLLFLLVLAHVAHLPVMAYGEVDPVTGRETTHHGHGHVDERAAHARPSAAAEPDGDAALLADRGGVILECLSTPGVIPTRVTTLAMLAFSTAVQPVTQAGASGSEVTVLPECAARRHLVLQVLLI